MEETTVIGRHAVLEALEGGAAVHKIWVQEGVGGPFRSALERRARERGVPVRVVPKARFAPYAALRHQGVIAFLAPFPYADAEALIRDAEAKEQALWVLLDGLTDPHNIGAVIRTAAATGADAVVLPKHQSGGLTPAAIKASAGAVFRLPVARVTNLVRLAEAMKAAGFWLIGASAAAERDYRQADYTGKAAIVVGSEGRGIRPLIRRHLDDVVRLPMKSGVESLNVSVAAALLLYEALRQREPIGG
ncbi:MAG: 23S rRNA (guanosine(2251)-2'-O)-methyltransferase RlmB [Hydrogenibacillus sp.]|nr:23S rRNA (guanosine(2251)-2'-O)-methyltransferase RlmB [Hydrogenibacillus sp.]